MTINIGINGMGRIGRMVIRAIVESKNKNIEIKHINSRSSAEVMASLLKHDSIHGKFNADFENVCDASGIDFKAHSYNSFDLLNVIIPDNEM